VVALNQHSMNMLYPGLPFLWCPTQSLEYSTHLSGWALDDEPPPQPPPLPPPLPQSPRWAALQFTMLRSSMPPKNTRRYYDGAYHIARHDTTRHDATRRDATRRDATRHDTTHIMWQTGASYQKVAHAYNEWARKWGGLEPEQLSRVRFPDMACPLRGWPPPLPLPPLSYGPPP